jgi:tetratricopeptide (TPR) repeat protein
VAGKRKLWLAVWSYYVVTLIPVLGLVQVGGQAMADRYTYLPGLGPFLLAGLMAGWLWGKVNKFQNWTLTIKVLSVVVAVFMLISMSYLAFKQMEFWKDSIVLWSYVLKKEPKRVYIAYINRGMAFHKMGRLDEALADYDKAIALYPSLHIAYYNRGVVFSQMGQLDRALADYNAAIALNPSYDIAYHNRGVVLSQMGRLDMALMDYGKAIELNPTFAEAYRDRGAVFFQMGQYEKALDDYGEAIALNSNDAASFVNRAFVYLSVGQNERALSDFKNACELGDSMGCAGPQYLLKNDLPR